MDFKIINMYQSKHVPSNTELLVINKDTAVSIIQDLANDLANTGITKLVLRTDDNRFFIIQVR